MNKIIFVLNFVLFCQPFMGQTKANDAKSENKISLNDIIGNWYSTDSSTYMISFINLNNSYVEINGIKHGVGNYMFSIEGDSISVNGFAPNWPPYYSTLCLLNKNKLEIAFYDIFSNGSTKIIYNRKINK